MLIDVAVRLRKSCIFILLSFWLTCGVSLFLTKSASAQDAPPPAQSPPSESQAPTDTSQQPAATPPHEAKPEEKPEQTDEKKDDKEKKQHRGAIVVAPLPIVSPAIGSGIIPVAGYIFPFQEKDKVSPPSVVGAAGLITNNGSWGFGLGADLYMKEDRYELKTVYGHGNIDYNLYGVG